MSRNRGSTAVSLTAYCASSAAARSRSPSAALWGSSIFSKRQAAELPPGDHHQVVPRREVVRPADRRRGFPHLQVQDSPAGPRRRHGHDVPDAPGQQGPFHGGSGEENRSGTTLQLRSDPVRLLQGADRHPGDHGVSRRD